MNIKQQRQFYFIYLAIPFLIAALLELNVYAGRLPLQDVPESVSYAASVVFTILSFALLFSGLCCKKFSFMFRLASLATCPNLVLLDYFFFGDTNLLFFIPIFLIAYLYLWPKENKECN